MGRTTAVAGAFAVFFAAEEEDFFFAVAMFLNSVVVNGMFHATRHGADVRDL
ncbi:hypothetical protein [Hylemonella gracilis]|uniref:hypothetical protein n=1 Tax=Hylemonella gracilis TaxID=80880 RepID=UPI00387310CB